MEKLYGKKYVAFFDLDHTILSVSSGAMLGKYLAEKKLLTLKHKFHFALAVILSKAHLITQHQAMSLVVKLWKNIPTANTVKSDDIFFQEYILGNIREDARKEINFHLSKNAAVIMLSASVTPVCIRVANHLGFDDVLCSELEIVNDIYTGSLVGRYCHGKQKTIRAKLWCETNSFSLKDAWYYGDDYEDRFILAAVGNPRCVTPRGKLKEFAARKNWEVLNWQ